jgi:hypothetical protein
MSISSARSNVARVQKVIADLRVKEAAEANKESDLFIKINRASESASRSSSASTLQSKLKEIERYQKASATSSKKRAGYAKQIASKSNELNRHMVALERAEKGERTKQEKQMKKSQADLKRRQMQLDRSLDRRIRISAKKLSKTIEVDNIQYDVFVSHASEDKESFVKDLAELKLKTDFGKLTVRAKEIAGIRFNVDSIGGVAVELKSGETFLGKPDFDSIAMKCSWGIEELGLSDIESVTVDRRVRFFKTALPQGEWRLGVNSATENKNVIKSIGGIEVIN